MLKKIFKLWCEVRKLRREVKSFIASNFYCSACGRKWRIKL